MNLFRPEDRAQNLSRNTRIGKTPARRRPVQNRWRSAVEQLENRCLLSIFDPHTDPLSPEPVEGTPLAPDIVLASFASPDPGAGLSASVVFNGGSPITAN